MIDGTFATASCAALPGAQWAPGSHGGIRPDGRSGFGTQDSHAEEIVPVGEEGIHVPPCIRRHPSDGFKAILVAVFGVDALTPQYSPNTSERRALGVVGRS